MKYNKKQVRRFKNMKDSYENIKGIKGNPVIYIVYRKDFGAFKIGLNVMEPGNINGEFFMTKGHNHKKSRNELYVLMEGEGKLLIQGKKVKIINLKKGKLYVVPGKSGHRLINIGNKKMKVLTIYSKDAGRGYDFRFKKRIMKKWI